MLTVDTASLTQIFCDVLTFLIMVPLGNVTLAITNELCYLELMCQFQSENLILQALLHWRSAKSRHRKKSLYKYKYNYCCCPLIYLILFSLFQRAFCAFCQDRIWGLGRQGFKCIQCKLLVHKKCHKLVQKPCSNEQVEPIFKEETNGETPTISKLPVTSSRNKESYQYKLYVSARPVDLVTE